MDLYETFGFVLEFDLLPHPWAWTLGSDVVECKLTLHGIHGASMNALGPVVTKIKYGLLENFNTV